MTEPIKPTQARNPGEGIGRISQRRREATVAAQTAAGWQAALPETRISGGAYPSAGFIPDAD